MDQSNEVRSVVEEAVAPANPLEGEFSGAFPISPLFAVKQSLPILFLIVVLLGLFFFGGPAFSTRVDNFQASLGVDQPVLYYSACGMLLLSVLYWLAYIARFRFGISQDVFYIKKGVFIQSSFDYPMRAIANIAIKRGFFDFFFMLSTLVIMTAHDESDDLASVRGLRCSSAEELHRLLRDVLVKK